jgi:hypothetical protein
MGHDPPDRNDPDLSKENDHVQDLVSWFLAHYEDPVESCPVEAGVYHYIWGGPVDDVAAEIHAQFPYAAESNLRRAAEILDTCESAGAWAKKPPPNGFNEEDLDVEGLDDGSDD